MGENEATKLGTDVFIALAAVGWADGELHRDEADAIAVSYTHLTLPTIYSV